MFKEGKNPCISEEIFRDTLGGVQDSWLIPKYLLLKTQNSPF